MNTAPGHIQGFIALDRDRARQRRQTALNYLSLAAILVLLLFGTGTVTIISERSIARRVTVNLADCPPLRSPLDPDVVTFTIAMKGDGTPEVKRCTRQYGQMKYQPRSGQ